MVGGNAYFSNLSAEFLAQSVLLIPGFLHLGVSLALASTLHPSEVEGPFESSDPIALQQLPA